MVNIFKKIREHIASMKQEQDTIKKYTQRTKRRSEKSKSVIAEMKHLEEKRNLPESKTKRQKRCKVEKKIEN